MLRAGNVDIRRCDANCFRGAYCVIRLHLNEKQKAWRGCGVCVCVERGGVSAAGGVGGEGGGGREAGVCVCVCVCVLVGGWVCMCVCVCG